MVSIKDELQKMRIRSLIRTYQLDPVIKLGFKVVPLLLQLLKDDNLIVKKNTLIILGKLKAIESLDYILELMDDVKLKKAVALSLFNFKNEKATKALIKLTRDYDPIVRTLAFEELQRRNISLHEIELDESIQLDNIENNVTSIILDEKHNEKNEKPFLENEITENDITSINSALLRVQEMVMHENPSVRIFGLEIAIDVCLRTLDLIKFRMADKNSECREKAAFGLEHINEIMMKDILASLKSEDENIRKHALFMLRKLSYQFQFRTQ